MTLVSKILLETKKDDIMESVAIVQAGFGAIYDVDDNSESISDHEQVLRTDMTASCLYTAYYQIESDTLHRSRGHDQKDQG